MKLKKRGKKGKKGAGTLEIYVAYYMVNGYGIGDKTYH